MLHRQWHHRIESCLTLSQCQLQRYHYALPAILMKNRGRKHQFPHPTHLTYKDPVRILPHTSTSWRHRLSNPSSLYLTGWQSHSISRTLAAAGTEADRKALVSPKLSLVLFVRRLFRVKGYVMCMKMAPTAEKSLTGRRSMSIGESPRPANHENGLR